MSSGYFGNLTSNNLAFKAVPNGSNISVTTPAVIVFPKTLYDRTNCYNTNNGTWSISATGAYDVSISFLLTTANQLNILVMQNGNDVGRIIQLNTTDPVRTNFVGWNRFSFVKGDVISLYAAQANNPMILYGTDTLTCQLTCTMIT